MRKGVHSQYDLQCYVVWIIKYRKNVLYGKIASRLKVLLMRGCSAYNISIIKGNILPDYVHLLISISATLLVSQVMKYLKERSSKKLQDEFQYLKKQFWGQHMWRLGIFVGQLEQ